MYAERRERDGWVLCEPLTPNTEYHPVAASSDLLLEPQPVYDTRNYALFAILADVRNPAHSDESYQPIAPRRGLPTDISAELAAWAADEEAYAFGHTWYLLSELQAFPWHERKITKRAMVAPRVAPLFAGGQGSFPREQWPADEPISYADWLSGGVEVTWLETYAESAGQEFLENTLPVLASYGGADAVRVVLWFIS